jgi:hypothetical protein
MMGEGTSWHLWFGPQLCAGIGSLADLRLGPATHSSHRSLLVQLLLRLVLLVVLLLLLVLLHWSSGHLRHHWLRQQQQLHCWQQPWVLPRLPRQRLSQTPSTVGIARQSPMTQKQ